MYVQPEGDSAFRTLTALAADGRAQATNDAKEYRLDAAIGKAKVYLSYDVDRFMLQSFEITATTPETAQEVTARANSYMIQLDPQLRTITWGYREDAFGADAYLEHGRAEVIAIEGVDDLHGQPFANNPGDDRGGHIMADAGKKVTIRLTPDYGYQLAGVQLNGGLTIAPQEEIGTFTFTMPDANVHFKGIFIKTEDSTEITTKSQSITSASIADGANAAGSGTLQLRVSDSTGYNTAAAQETVSGAVAAQALELDLRQLVAKGDGGNWETEIHEFEHPVTLSLGISDYDPAYDYVVVRDHNGTATALPTTVSDGKVTFATNRFSTYVIVKKQKIDSGSGATGGNTPDTGAEDDKSDNSDNNGSDTSQVTPTPQAMTAESALDPVPKTGERDADLLAECVFGIGGILLIGMGILFRKNIENF